MLVRKKISELSWEHLHPSFLFYSKIYYLEHDEKIFNLSNMPIRDENLR